MHISKLKEWGYLVPGRIMSGIITWSLDGKPIGSISIQANTICEQPYIELDYKYRGEQRNYKVYLTATPSNLNKGKIWYFVCPVTKRRCRKLYSQNGYFVHREAVTGYMYETQTRSKKARKLEKMVRVLFETDSLESEIYKKYFKKTYAGKLTKRYKRLMNKIQEAKNVPFQEVIKLLTGR